MKIEQLILETSKLESLHEFYGTLLGLPIEQLTHEKINIRIGSTELVFKQASADGPFYHFAINIPANKIGEAKDWLQQRVEPIWIDQYRSDIADFVNWCAKSVYFYDPAGNILELIARFDLDNKTSESFTSAQFLCVSEIGLVFSEQEFEKKTGELLANYQLTYFDKQPPLPQFRAIGDDQGLFIIVPEKRNWFPTSNPSGIYPMHIDFANDGKEYQLDL